MSNLWHLTAFVLLLFLGCARFPAEPVSNPAPRQLIVTLRFAAPVDDRYYYLVALDTNQDPSDGPVPVIQGPYWGNGWGTGPITRFVEYYSGQFGVYQPFVLLTLTSTQGSITGLQGSPTQPVAGTHTLTVEGVILGTAPISGDGNILTVTNLSDQNAGVLTITTDLSGTTVPGGVSFAPASVGGRALTATEQQALDALNASGVALAPDSLAALGLSLTVRTSDFVAGAQTITIAPTQGSIQDTFVPAGGFAQTQSSGQAVANATSDPSLSPITGVAFVAAELQLGQTATVVAQMAPTATYLGPPYLQEPVTGDTLSFTLDLDTLGPASQVQNLDLNFIATDKLIIDPESTEQKTYDALGPLGDPYFVTISTRYTFAYTNELSLVPEEQGDCDIPALDIVDWSVEIRLL